MSIYKNWLKDASDKNLKYVNKVLETFKKHGIELIAYGGFNLQLVRRDKKINTKSINFIINQVHY